MPFFEVSFAVSKVQTSLLLPPVVAFVISFFTSMGGVSGAFLLLPFQMTFLHYTAPSVSGTNQVFNIVAIPSSVFRYIKEKRMVWPLTLAVIIGTLPGVILGVFVRIMLLPDPRQFKFFVGLVLCYIGFRLLWDIFSKKRPVPASSDSAGKSAPLVVSNTRFSFSRVSFEFDNTRFSFSFPGVFLLCFVVGIIGGVYGIGGGAIVAPFFVTFLGLPVHAVAGAALMGTFVTSVAGVVVYQILAFLYPALSIGPDWALGFLFGLGGVCGMYLGARCQKHVPATLIKSILCASVLFVAGRYILIFLFI